MKMISKCLGLCAALLLAPLMTPAAESPGNAPAKSSTTGAESQPAKAKRDWYPFYGYVASTDISGKTITLRKKEGGRVLKLDEKSQLEVDGKAATLRDVKVGDYARGRVRKDKAGAEVIVAAKFDKEAAKRAKTSSTGSTSTSPRTTGTAPASGSAK